MNEFAETIKESPINAALEALTILVLKNSSSEYEKQYTMLLDFFESNKEQLAKCSYMVKIMEIYSIVYKNEQSLLKNLQTIDCFLDSLLRNKIQAKQVQEKPEEKTFKKWWS